MRRHPSIALPLLAFALTGTATIATPVIAQQPAMPPLAPPLVQRLPLLGGEMDDAGRLARLRGTDSTRPDLLRAPSRLLPWRGNGVTLLLPELTIGRNTGLAYGFNDGPLWQGRGTNLLLTAGVAGAWGPVRLILAPQYAQSENAGYQVIPSPQGDSARSPWANPFHPAPFGIDLPLRQGDRPIRQLFPGQSSVTVRAGAAELGLSTENAWWGPGMLNAIALGASAAGVPSAFVRTARPVATRAGTWDGWLSVGSLAESPWFDRDPSNDTRTLAALALDWRPPNTSGVELGIARLVIAKGTPTLGAVVYPFRSVGRPNGPDSLAPGDRDQVTSLWARWAPPGVGFEAWVEWARFEEPASIRDFLEMPGHSQGYTLGLQWTRALAADSHLRLWGEATYLEPSPSLRLRPVGATYVSRSVPQGFTNRGQPLGAAIGPGGSSQWLDGDWFHRRWRLGAYAGRVRWDNAALFTPVVPQVRREDISLVGGLRAAGEWGGVRLLADWAHSVRLNYLFQAYLTDPVAGRTSGVDIVNDALTLTISAPLGSR